MTKQEQAVLEVHDALEREKEAKRARDAAVVESLARPDSVEKLALIDKHFDIEDVPEEEQSETEEEARDAA